MGIRVIYYYLIQSRPELELTKMGKPYGSLNEHITNWKKEGKLSREWFEDRSRPDVDDVPDETPEEYTERMANQVRYSDYYYDIYRWFRQPIYVEVWVEKDTMQPILQQILEGKQIRVAVCKGYMSDAKLYEHAKRLARYQKQGKKIVILYLGDLDPSGENMDRSMPHRLLMMGVGLYHNIYDKSKFEFKRIAVTMKQVERYSLYKLTPNIKPGDDEETIKTKKRMLRDPRRKEFIRYHGELFGVELDAMAAKGAFEDLARIVRRQADNCFRKDIAAKYEEYLSKENARKWLIQKYNDALNEIADEWDVSGDEEPTPDPDPDAAVDTEEEEEEEEDNDESK